MSTEQLEVTRRALATAPVRAETALVYADALEEAGHPFAPFARGRYECTEQDLPEEFARWMLGSRRGETERLVFEHGVLRGVRFLPHRTLRERMNFGGDDGFYVVEEFEQRAEPIVELLTAEAFRTVTHVSGVTFETFRRLCELDLRLREVAVIDATSEWDEEAWWFCGTEAEPEPEPVGRLRVQELVLVPARVTSAQTPRWLLASCRPVFDGLEVLREPSGSSACAGVLSTGHAGSLRLMETRDWRATRDEHGWHLVVGSPADGVRLYEDLDPWSFERLLRDIAELSAFVADVLVQGPQLPLGELPAFELAAGRTPIRFELGHPAEAATRAARGLPERRFDAEAPLIDHTPPF